MAETCRIKCRPGALQIMPQKPVVGNSGSPILKIGTSKLRPTLNGNILSVYLLLGSILYGQHRVRSDVMKKCNNCAQSTQMEEMAKVNYSRNTLCRSLVGPLEDTESIFSCFSHGVPYDLLKNKCAVCGKLLTL